MRTVLLVALSLCFAGVVLTAAPTAAACNPPHCPGFGACHASPGYVYVDPDTMTVEVRPLDIECYY